MEKEITTMAKKGLGLVALVVVVVLVAACAQPAVPPATTPPPATIPSPVTTTPPVITPPATTTPPPVTTPPSVITPPDKVPVRGPNDVWIQGFTFTPQVLTVALGTTVTWTNKDQDPHDVTSDPAGLFGQQLSGLGGTFSFPFTKAGTYNYVCTIHPGMAGSIVVK
jgi:plastocyanin